MNYLMEFKSFPLFKKKFLSYFPKNAFKKEFENHCWEWQGNKKNNAQNYGFIKFGSVRYYAHRMSYMIFNGSLSKENMVMHTCDNFCCVNPKHLILGNQAINMSDCVKRGRHPETKLNSEAIKVIKWMLKYQNYYGLAAKLSRLYKVCPNQISLIKNNHCWNWIKV